MDPDMAIHLGVGLDKIPMLANHGAGICTPIKLGDFVANVGVHIPAPCESHRFDQFQPRMGLHGKNHPIVRAGSSYIP